MERSRWKTRKDRRDAPADRATDPDGPRARAAHANAAPQRGCLDDGEALALVEGTCSAAARGALLGHVETCPACGELIAGLLGSASDVRDEATPPPEVCGAYRFGPVIAEGGMGRIYRATDLELGRDVAIKVPRKLAPALSRRFDREVAITARLQHPGIVPVHGAGQLPDGTRFYVMPFVEGVRLDQAVDRAPDRDARYALLAHLVSVAETMAYVHAERIVHRDLKPNNVLIGRFGEAVIIDWGLAKVLAPRGELTPASRDSTSLDRYVPGAEHDEPSDAPSTTTRAGDVLGTPAFMSPEQAAGAPLDERADVFALGVMLYFVVTGQTSPARPGDDDALPPALAEVYRQAVATDPAARFGDAGAFAAALRRALAAASQPPVRVAQRRVAAMVLAGVVLAGAGAAVIWSRATRDRARPAAATLEPRDREPSGTQWIALDPTGQRVAYCGLGRLEIRDLATGRTWNRPGLLPWPAAVQFDTPDVVTFFALDGAGGSSHRVRWDLQSGATTPLPSSPAAARGAWFGRLDAGDLLQPVPHDHRLEIVGSDGTREVPSSGRQQIVDVAIAPSRRRFAFLDGVTPRSAAIRVVDARTGRTLVSPTIADPMALTWLDDDTLLYAAGTGGASVIDRVAATADGLAHPTTLYTYREADSFVGSLAAGGGRVLVSLVASAFESHIFDRAATLVDDRLDPVVASAPLGWRDDGSFFTWNRNTGEVELGTVAHGPPPSPTGTAVHGDPADVTRAGSILIVAVRAEGGRRVEATAIGEREPRWTAAPGALWFVRCAGDAAEPCVAGQMTQGAITVRRIDPASGTLGQTVVPPGDITDAAIDPSGTSIAWVVGDGPIYERPLDGSGSAAAPVTRLTGVHSIAFAPHGGLLASASVADAREVDWIHDGRIETLVRTGATVVSLVRPSPGGGRLLYRARTLTSELAELRLPRP